MENYDEMYNHICRVCLNYQNSDNFVSLIDNSCEDGLSCYGKAVRTFAQISIKTKDDLPNMMCQNCLLLLKQAICFKLTCEYSEKRLKVLCRKKVNKDSNDVNIKEIIVQYALFSHYFPNGCSRKPISHFKSVNTDELKKTEQEFQVNVETADDFNDCTFQDGSQENKPFDSSDEDSSDEILNRLEKLTQSYPNLENTNCKTNVKRKISKRNRIQIKKLRLARNRLQCRKMQYIQSELKSSKSEKFVCKVCHRVLANQHTYDHHMQRHNGCRFICEHCGKGFPILAELQMHQVARHGTGPFLQCQHCTYKAPRKLNLIEHERIHTGERPYTCDKCGLTFRRRAIWRKHMIYHMEKTVQCPHCPRKFYRRSEMQAHANSIHERLYVYLCHKCDATYAKTETVRRHLTERHGIPREMQGKIVRINKGRGSSFPEQ